MSDDDTKPFDFASVTRAHLEHAKSCTARPCRVCDLDRCRCGQDMLRSGTLRDLVGESRVFRMCEACADREVRRLRIKRVEDTIPEGFGWARLKTPELGQHSGIKREQLQQAWDTCVLGNSSLVLVGEAGAGKTSAAIALFRAMLERGFRDGASAFDRRRAFSAAFFSAHDLARDRARHGLGEESPLVARALGSSVAVIDDLGNETDGALSAIPEILYERHARGRPTWITTWLTQDKAQHKYNSGAARRIFERAAVLEIVKGS